MAHPTYMFKIYAEGGNIKFKHFYSRETQRVKLYKGNLINI